MKEMFEVIDLEWEEPFKIGYERETDTYNLESIPDDLLEQYGLYQIYGRHPVYGQNVLLYIGETKKGKSGTRSFKNRLYEHFRVDGQFYYYTNISISLCPVKLSDDQVLIAESILIATHKPAMNKKHLEAPSQLSKSHLVRNWGFMRSLQQECSGCYFHQ